MGRPCDSGAGEVRRGMTRADISIAWLILTVYAAVADGTAKGRLAQIPRYPVACEGFVPFAP